ncbi:MAG TPA: class I SAM-dependent methyltransferase [Bryobacteraceae bacterium]|nr:class I SAM-dependent methyltransferase [Bryobacteraceae bacterium]
MNCDCIAVFYRWLEYAVFGRALERRRMAFLTEASRARRVLALGDGDGRALAALVAAASSARIEYVDSSAKMLELARARAGTDRVHYRRADAREIDFAEFREFGARSSKRLGDSGFDLIVTHFFLDCLDETELQAVVDKTARAAAPCARWIVSEFRPATIYARLLIAVMYAFFQKATGLKTRRLADHHPLFLHHGFRLERVERTWAGMLASELWVR